MSSDVRVSHRSACDCSRVCVRVWYVGNSMRWQHDPNNTSAHSNSVCFRCTYANDTPVHRLFVRARACTLKVDRGFSLKINQLIGSGTEHTHTHTHKCWHVTASRRRRHEHVYTESFGSCSLIRCRRAMKCYASANQFLANPLCSASRWDALIGGIFWLTQIITLCSGSGECAKRRECSRRR